jgi:hypothetical protein
MENFTYNKDEAVPLTIFYGGKELTGEAVPLSTSCRTGTCYEMDVVLNGERLGTIYCGNDMKWTLQGGNDPDLAEKIGEQILMWYK